jgi:CubicO group peptidase (beta-lactamase class C family)
VFDSRGLLALGAVGRRKADDPTPVTSQDLWHLGSNTKAMTATLAAMLVEDGKLSWTSTLAEVFPDWAETMNPGYRSVPLELLFTHRAGLPANPPPSLLKEAAQESAPDRQRRLVAARMLSLPPAFAPGSRFEYSNTGYMWWARLWSEPAAFPGRS